MAGWYNWEMEEKFKNKYQIKSARLSGYDYSQNGIYFVTICTRDQEDFFGEIKNCEMVLNGLGRIVEDELSKTPTIRPNVKLDTWIVMPNHVHVILEIYNRIDTRLTRRDALQCVSTEKTEKPYKNAFGPQINNLSSIIRGFKGMVTKRARMCGFYFFWQPRFYDHIIRNAEELNRIREYIISNPKEWERDRNNLKNLYM